MCASLASLFVVWVWEVSIDVVGDSLIAFLVVEAVVVEVVVVEEVTADDDDDDEVKEEMEFLSDLILLRPVAHKLLRALTLSS